MYVWLKWINSLTPPKALPWHRKCEKKFESRTISDVWRILVRQFINVVQNVAIAFYLLSSFELPPSIRTFLPLFTVTKATVSSLFRDALGFLRFVWVIYSFDSWSFLSICLSTLVAHYSDQGNQIKACAIPWRGLPLNKHHRVCDAK